MQNNSNNSFLVETQHTLVQLQKYKIFPLRSSADLVNSIKSDITEILENKNKSIIIQEMNTYLHELCIVGQHKKLPVDFNKLIIKLKNNFLEELTFNKIAVIVPA